MALNSNALTSLANLKLQLGMPPGNASEDTRLEMFINAASARIAEFCNRIFEENTYTEIHSGRRGNYLLPMQYPVTSITELRFSQARNWTDPGGLVDPQNYTIADFNTSVQYDGILPGGVNNIRLVYVAGYSTIPSDLELCALWYCEWYYRHRTREDMGKTSTSKGDESIGILSETPKMIKEIMMGYKRSEFVNTATGVRNA